MHLGATYAKLNSLRQSGQPLHLCEMSGQLSAEQSFDIRKMTWLKIWNIYNIHNFGWFYLPKSSSKCVNVNTKINQFHWKHKLFLFSDKLPKICQCHCKKIINKRYEFPIYYAHFQNDHKMKWSKFFYLCPYLQFKFFWCHSWLLKYKLDAYETNLGSIELYKHVFMKTHNYEDSLIIYRSAFYECWISWV